MAFTTAIITSASDNLDFAYTYSNQISASAKLSINETIPTGTINNFVNFSFNTGSGVFLAMASNINNYDLVIKTNNTSTPTNTFNVSSTGNLIYYKFLTDKDSFGAPIQNITGIFVNNTGALEASLRIDSLFDSTPGI